MERSDSDLFRCSTVGAVASSNTRNAKVDAEDGTIYRKDAPVRKDGHDVKELETFMILYCRWPQESLFWEIGACPDK